MLNKKQKIHERLKQDYEYVKSLGYDVFGVFLQGSQNYQLDYEGSDIDTKCIVLPSAEDVILQRPFVSKTLVLEDNSHIDLKDIRLMWNYFKKQNINYLEILFTSYYYVPTKYLSNWLVMSENKESIAHIDNYAAVNCIVGMVFEKNSALCHPYPSLIDKIEKYGFDPKQLHHIIRCREFLDRYIAGVSYKDCLIPTDRDFLIKVKADCPYTVDEAKAIAKDAVDYVKAVKQAYFESNSRVTVEETCIKMNQVLVDTLKEAWSNE